jgi:hypothetical protein
MIYGLAFIGFVYLKGKYRRNAKPYVRSNATSQESKNFIQEIGQGGPEVQSEEGLDDGQVATGVMQQLGIFYAMGFALFCQVSISPTCYDQLDLFGSFLYLGVIQIIRDTRRGGGDEVSHILFMLFKTLILILLE